METFVVDYNSNNSGGDWWISDEDWHNLEASGWEVQWIRNSSFHRYQERFIGALATHATFTISADNSEKAMALAVASWERITNQDSTEEGCSCCGQPHNFYPYPQEQYLESKRLSAEEDAKMDAYMLEKGRK